MSAKQESSANRAQNLLEALHLPAERVGALPPELRDALLDYAGAWAAATDLLMLTDLLREAHGPLLFLLDHQASGYLRAGEPEAALEVIERRQRRSTTIASQALEAEALLAAGHDAHALAVANDIIEAAPRNATALTTGATVLAKLGRFDEGADLLQAYLADRPRDLQATLTMATLATEAREEQLSSEYIERLGAGIPAGITPRQLQSLAALMVAADRPESARAAQVELERRRTIQFQELAESLAPFTGHEPVADEDLQAIYRHLGGTSTIEVDRREERKIQIDMARHFGYMKLREGQAETIASAQRGESILTVMPTGAGKSVCYQLPALTQPRATLVISPLIALMKDQVESLPTTARKKATFINSTLSDEELSARMAGIARGDYKLIYAAPERLRQRGFLRALRGAGLDLFVVDEAHCVSLWGHDFRPDYLFIQEARAELGNPPALAMTATAPPRVRDEIVDYMSDIGEASGAERVPQRPHVLALDIFRDNLHLSALRFHNEEEKLAALLKFVTETEGSGIVYVNSRHRAESLAFHLREAGVAAEAYHAGISGRGAVQDRFMSDATRVVVATIAFGMGIDKSDIRFIVHFHPSRSLAAYYQEVGRAGRDGVLSQGVLFYSNNDWANLRRWAKSDEFTVEYLERVYVAIANQLDVKLDIDKIETAMTDDKLATAIGPVDARRLQQVLNTDETSVRVAVSLLERADLISRTFDLPRELSITMPKKLAKSATEDNDFLRLQRGLALRPGKAAVFQTADVAAFMDWPLAETEAWLYDMQNEGWLQVEGAKRAMLMELPSPPNDIRTRLERLLTQSSAVAQRRIDDVIGYATAETCRHGYISAHFGSPPRSKCDVCDNCTGIRPDIPEPEAPAHPLPEDVDIAPMVLDCLVSLPKPVGRSGLARILTGSLRAPVKPNEARHHGRLKALGEAMVMNHVDDLLEGGQLRQYSRSGYPVLAATMRGRAQAEAWLAGHPELAAYGKPPEEPEVEETPVENVGDKYTALQKALWSWRRRSAEEQGQPPYVIMSNEIMLTIAEQRPQTIDDLALVPGMGTQRLQHYGPVILDLIRLNPPQAGDEELMAAQRTELQTQTGAARAKAQALGAGVSPRCERLIFIKLQELRQKEAVHRDGKPSYIANNSLLKAIAARGPESQDELEAILGFRSSGLRDAAPQILAIVEAARQETAADVEEQE